MNSSVEYNLESNFKLECSRDIYTLHWLNYPCLDIFCNGKSNFFSKSRDLIKSCSGFCVVESPKAVNVNVCYLEHILECLGGKLWMRFLFATTPYVCSPTYRVSC